MAFENGNKEGKKFSKEYQPENPGRPKKLPPLDELIADVLGEEKDGIEAARAILMALRAKATKGDIRAAELLLNRGYGLPKQKIDMNVDGGIVLVGIRPKDNEGMISNAVPLISNGNGKDH